MLFINSLSIYLISITILAFYWAAHVKTMNGSNYSKAIILLSIAVCIYIFGYTLEINSVTSSQIVFWNKVEYIGIPFISALWLTSSLMYTGNFLNYKKLIYAAIYIIPIITLLLRFTNSYHFLYFSSESYVEKFGKVFFVKAPGIWMYVQTVHSLLMIIIAMGLFVYHSVKSEKKQLGKTILMVFASVISIVGLFCMEIDPLLLPIDYMAACLPLTGFLVVLAVARYDLLETKSLARSKTFEAASDAILIINSQQKVIDYNNCARQLFEQISIHLENGSLTSLFSRVPDLLDGLMKPDSSVIKMQIDSEDRYFDITTENIDSYHSPLGWIKTIRDVTEIYQLNAELKKQTLTDELSTLNNRRAFLQIGNEWLLNSDKHGHTLHLSMMDLDHFKNVNDQYGHHAGDVVIQNFCRILKEHFNENSLIARLGGEEFAVLYLDSSNEEVHHKLINFSNNIQRHRYHYNNNQFCVTVSIGITKRQPGQTLESMMRKADKALYLSKDKGRNCITTLF